MATIVRSPLFVSKTQLDPYPIDCRTLVSAVASLTLLAATALPAPYAAVLEPPRAAPYPTELRTTLTNPAATTLLLLSAVPPETVGRYTGTERAAFYPFELRTTLTNPAFGQILTPLPSYQQNLPSIAPYVLPPYGPDFRTWARGNPLTTEFFSGTPISQPPIWELPPRAASYPTDLRTWQWPTCLSLTTPAPVLPPGNASTSVPVTATYPIDLRTSKQAPTIIPPPANPAFIQNDTNLQPRTIQYPVDLRNWTPQISLALEPQGLPFAQFDWPSPKAADYPASLRTTIFFYVQDQNTPPEPSDVPTQLPRTSVYPIDLRTFIQSALPVLISVRAPYQPTEWPLTAPAVYPIMLRTLALDLQQTTLFSSLGTPVGQISTELPRFAPYGIDLRAILVNLHQSTLNPPPIGPPVAQYDWPPPRAAFYPYDYRTFVHPLSLTLYGQDTMFGGPGQPLTPRDWSVPHPPKVLRYDFVAPTPDVQIAPPPPPPSGLLVTGKTTIIQVATDTAVIVQFTTGDTFIVQINSSTATE